MTQDIEIVWALRKIGYDVRMSLDAKVYTSAPSKLKVWWKQRNRWNIGGMQTLIKHKSQIFKNNILGNFIIPFFSISLFIGIIGIILLMNNLINNIQGWVHNGYAGNHLMGITDTDIAVGQSAGVVTASAIVQFNKASVYQFVHQCHTN